jgi:hypothetical protein
MQKIDIVGMFIVIASITAATMISGYNAKINTIKDVRLKHDMKLCVECHKEWDYNDRTTKR